MFDETVIIYSTYPQPTPNPPPIFREFNSNFQHTHPQEQKAGINTAMKGKERGSD